MHSDEIAHEVWRQITSSSRTVLARVWAYGSSRPRSGMRSTSSSSSTARAEGHGRREDPSYNHAPYLIPIVGDWKNRPGAFPWNPHGSTTPSDRQEDAGDQKKIHVWQAGHGGYQVHYDKLVFAGTWCKTFTRMTGMEAACESGRHAVNAILDHYVYESRIGKTTDLPALSWRCRSDLSTRALESYPPAYACRRLLLHLRLENRDPRTPVRPEDSMRNTFVSGSRIRGECGESIPPRPSLPASVATVPATPPTRPFGSSTSFDSGEPSSTPCTEVGPGRSLSRSLRPTPGRENSRSCARGESRKGVAFERKHHRFGWRRPDPGRSPIGSRARDPARRSQRPALLRETRS